MMKMISSLPHLITSIILISIIFCYGTNTHGECIQSESEALLEFKRGIVEDYSQRLASWGSETNCCSWFGVVCDNLTGHVLELHLQNAYSDDYFPLKGNINESLLELKHLKHLDLSNNALGHLTKHKGLRGISIPEFFGFMSILTFLNLSNVGFKGKIPTFIGNLTSLDTLDLSLNHFEGEIPHELGNLSNLQYLSIPSDTYIDKLDWISKLSSLKFLDFRNVNLSESSDWAESLGKLPSLQQLNLSNCQLSHITSSIGNLTSLTNLDLSNNNNVGAIPLSFKRLCNLRFLSLSNTQVSQEVNELIEILADCAADKLGSLDLSHSQLSGHLSNVLKKFKSLVSLDLSVNSITGPLPICFGEMNSLASLDLSSNNFKGSIPTSFGEMNSLAYLDLSFNNLKGSIPTSFGELAKLKTIDISSNLLEGAVSEIHFKNHSCLIRFNASGNHLTLRVNPDWIPSFQLLEELYLESWDVGPMFPTWLRHLNHLNYLDLSNSKIFGTLPTWFVNVSSTLRYLNLSHNQMHGMMIHNLSIDDSYFSSIDLSYNLFTGPLPYMSSSPYWVDISHNWFSGSMHNFLCKKMPTNDPLFRTKVLILEENHLDGEIPDCWMYWSSLWAVDLSNNNFSGNIPTSIVSSNLWMLNLRSNKLTGDISSVIRNITGLVLLDIAENELHGEIPNCIGKHLGNLMVLNLRRNKFHGRLPKEICNLSGLQILDVADNNLNGIIPSCVGNFTGMSREISYSRKAYVPFLLFSPNTGEYMGSSSIVRKGKMVEYKKILPLVQTLDLSNNNFEGEIPGEITSLSELQSLNLSYNCLTGRIPKDIGAMKKLESLDLSQNRLIGEIPPSMSGMTFLSNLNLSNNKLSGQIPSSTQMQTMDPSSFIDNKLCGPPLTKVCNNNDKEATPPSKETESMDWFSFRLSLVPGFVVGFWCIVGPLTFNTRWRHAYFNFLEILWDKMWVWYHINIIRFVRNYGL